MEAVKTKQTFVTLGRFAAKVDWSQSKKIIAFYKDLSKKTIKITSLKRKLLIDERRGMFVPGPQDAKRRRLHEGVYYLTQKDRHKLHKCI